MKEQSKWQQKPVPQNKSLLKIKCHRVDTASWDSISENLPPSSKRGPQLGPEPTLFCSHSNTISQLHWDWVAEDSSAPPPFCSSKYRPAEIHGRLWDWPEGEQTPKAPCQVMTLQRTKDCRVTQSINPFTGEVRLSEVYYPNILTHERSRHLVYGYI